MKTLDFFTPPILSIEWYGPGQTATEAKLGSLVLVRHHGLAPQLIRFGQTIRRYGVWSWTNHAAIIIDATSGSLKIAEATASGVVVTPLDNYIHEIYCVVTFDVTDQERINTANYAISTEGVKYGWVTIGGEVVYVLTGLPIVLGWGRSIICSGDSCLALMSSGIRPNKNPSMVLPADLAEYVGAAPSMELLDIIKRKKRD